MARAKGSAPLRCDDMADRIEHIGVVGSGLMGSGITEVCARAGLDVTVVEADAGAAERGQERLHKSLQTGARRGKLTEEEVEAAIARVRYATDLAELADRELVIEAITEDAAAKVAVFKTLDQVVASEHAILASNTSSIPIMKLATVTRRPEQVVGLHFFNPVQVMKLVEVVRCVTSSEEAFAFALEFGQRLGKLTVQTKDQAGFIVNRVLIPYLLDAIRAYEEGVGSISEIDQAMKAGAAHPMGPLVLCDFIGLDTLGAICDALFSEFCERRFAQPPLLRKMLAAGWYGKKSGMGFYDYSGAAPVENPGLA